jgi:magnesium transporter
MSSLSEHATFLATKVSFVLDATLGMISNEQNRIVKIVSIAAVVFLPRHISRKYLWNEL